MKKHLQFVPKVSKIGIEIRYPDFLIEKSHPSFIREILCYIVLDQILVQQIFFNTAQFQFRMFCVQNKVLVSVQDPLFCEIKVSVQQKQPVFTASDSVQHPDQNIFSILLKSYNSI